MVPGSGSVGSASWVWTLIALCVPFCYAIEDIIVTAIPEGEDGVIAAFTGAIIAVALTLAPVTLLSGTFISPEIAISAYGWAFFLVAAISAFSTILLVYKIRTTGAVLPIRPGFQ